MDNSHAVPEGFFSGRRPAVLTDEERQLIDEAVAKGRVQRIPRGVSGILYENERPKKWRNPNFGKFDPLVRDRRDRVVAMAPTMTVKEIAAAIKMPEHTVRSDLSARKVTALPHPRRARFAARR